MTRNDVSVRIEAGDSVRAMVDPARDGLPDFVHVSLGYDLHLWGPPDEVVLILCEALVRTCEAITAAAENGTTDGGLVARVSTAAAALVKEG